MSTTLNGSGVTFTSGSVMNPAGSAPSFANRSWVRFDSNSGTPSINGSGNTSSISDFGVGNYGLNFNTALPDANYATVGSSSRAINSTGGSETILIAYGYSASQTSFEIMNQGAANHDAPVVDVIVVR